MKNTKYCQAFYVKNQSNYLTFVAQEEGGKFPQKLRTQTLLITLYL